MDKINFVNVKQTGHRRLVCISYANFRYLQAVDNLMLDWYLFNTTKPRHNKYG